MNGQVDFLGTIDSLVMIFARSSDRLFIRMKVGHGGDKILS